MVEFNEFEDTARFSDDDLAYVKRQIRARQAGVDLDEEDEEEGVTEMHQIGWDDLEPLDSETAAFSLEAPSLKMLAQLEAQAMPHATPAPAAAPTPSTYQAVLAMAAGSAAALVCVATCYTLLM